MKTLRSRLAFRGVATLIPFLLASSPVWAQGAKPAGGDSQPKTAMCIGCHNIPGYQSSFPEVHKVPMISGQSAKYIVAALQAYQKGDRRHPTMRGIAASLTEQDMIELGNYYANHGKDLPPKPATVGEPSGEIDALLKKGNCVACHGEGLNKPIDPSYPKLGGQHADYLYVSLKAYQTDKNASVGRNNAIMATQAKMFTLPELKMLSKYIEGLGGDLKTVPQSRFK